MNSIIKFLNSKLFKQSVVKPILVIISLAGTIAIACICLFGAVIEPIFNDRSNKLPHRKYL